MSTKSRIDIPELLRKSLSLFDSFDQVYLFGSSLDQHLIPNDLDILLIYTEYSHRIKESTSRIYEELGKATGMSIDLTVLSVEEKTSTSFLNRIAPNYLRIK